MPAMYVIGLGGTGTAIVGGFARKLRELGVGRDLIKVRAIDIAADAIEDQVRRGNLKEDEVLQLRHPDLMQFIDYAENIIGKRMLWYPLKSTAIQMLKQYRSGAGVNRVRPNARFILNCAGSMVEFVREHIRDDLRRLKETIVSKGMSPDEFNNMAIWIIFALGGGTGSGIALDIAKIVREEFSEITGNPAHVFAIVVLPTFRGVQARPEYVYNTYAALKDLYYFKYIKNEESFDMMFLVGFNDVQGQDPYADVDEKVVYFLLTTHKLPYAPIGEAGALAWENIFGNIGNVENMFGNIPAMFAIFDSIELSVDVGKVIKLIKMKREINELNKDLEENEEEAGKLIAGIKGRLESLNEVIEYYENNVANRSLGTRKVFVNKGIDEVRELIANEEYIAKTALESLITIYGKLCKELDQKVSKIEPKIENSSTIVQAIGNLLEIYNDHCKKMFLLKRWISRCKGTYEKYKSDYEKYVRTLNSAIQKLNALRGTLKWLNSKANELREEEDSKKKRKNSLEVETEQLFTELTQGDIMETPNKWVLRFTENGLQSIVEKYLGAEREEELKSKGITFFMNYLKYSREQLTNIIEHLYEALQRLPVRYNEAILSMENYNPPKKPVVLLDSEDREMIIGLLRQAMYGVSLDYVFHEDNIGPHLYVAHVVSTIPMHVIGDITDAKKQYDDLPVDEAKLLYHVEKEAVKHDPIK